MALLNLANRIASKQVACSKNRKNGRLWPNCIRQRQGHGVLQPVASYADAKAERLMLPDFIDYRSGWLDKSEQFDANQILFGTTDGK